MNRHDRGVVRVLHGERSDGKRAGPGIQRERMRRWVMQGRDSGGETMRGDNGRGSERTGWPGGLIRQFMWHTVNATGLIRMTTQLMYSMLFINRETGRIYTWGEKKKGIVTDRWRKKERTPLYPITGSALSCPLLQLTENLDPDSARESGLAQKIYGTRLHKQDWLISRTGGRMTCRAVKLESYRDSSIGAVRKPKDQQSSVVILIIQISISVY